MACSKCIFDVGRWWNHPFLKEKFGKVSFPMCTPPIRGPKLDCKGYSILVCGEKMKYVVWSSMLNGNP